MPYIIYPLGQGALTWVDWYAATPAVQTTFNAVAEYNAAFDAVLAEMSAAGSAASVPAAAQAIVETAEASEAMVVASGSAVEAFAAYEAAGGAVSAIGASGAEASAVLVPTSLEATGSGFSVVGLGSVSVGTAAAAIAPLAGVALGVGLYELAPDFWTELSQTILPWAYENGEVPVISTGDGNTYLPGSLIRDVMNKLVFDQKYQIPDYVGSGTYTISTLSSPADTLAAAIASTGFTYNFNEAAQSIIDSFLTTYSGYYILVQINHTQNSYNGWSPITIYVQDLHVGSTITLNGTSTFRGVAYLEVRASKSAGSTTFNVVQARIQTNGYSPRIVGLQHVNSTTDILSNIGLYPYEDYPTGVTAWPGTVPADPSVGAIDVVTNPGDPADPSTVTTERYYPVALPEWNPIDKLVDETAQKIKEQLDKDEPEVEHPLDDIKNSIRDYVPLNPPSIDPTVNPDPTTPANPDTQSNPYIDPSKIPWKDPYKIPDYNPDTTPTENPSDDPSDQPTGNPGDKPISDPDTIEDSDPSEEPEPQPQPEPYTPGSPTDTGESPSVPDDPDVVPWIDPPFDIAGTSGGLITVYNPTSSQLYAFASWLWVSWQNTTLQTLWNNPFDGVIGLHELYATPNRGSSQNIRSGFLDSGISSITVPNRYSKLNCGNIVIPEFYGNYLDYAPYTKAYAYLPFVGIVELDADDIVGHAVNITYYIDAYTGTCIAQLTVAKDNYSNLNYQFSGNCAVELPLSGGSQASIKAGMLMAAATGISSAIGGIANIMGGKISGAISGMANGAADAFNSVVTAKSSVQHSGSFGGNPGAMGVKKPYIIVKRPVQKIVTNYQLEYGFPAHKFVRIGACTGYLRVRECNVISSTATNDEKQQIEELLKAGVFVQ